MKTSLLSARQPLCRGGLLAVALHTLAVATLSAQTLSSVVPVDVANGAQASQTDWNNFGWQSFVAVNWPSMPPAPSGISGQPDTTKTIGATSTNGALIPTTWLTWRTASSTFQRGAPNPGPWDGFSENSLLARKGRKELLSTTLLTPLFPPMLLNMTSKVNSSNAFAIDDINEASGNPLIDQAGWYVIDDIRLSQSEYTYILQNQYYDAVAQKQAFSTTPPTFNGFPRDGVNLPPPAVNQPMFNPPLPAWAQFGATEVKASWRVLDPVKDKDKMSRYYTQVGYFLQPDGKTWEGPTIYGLIGLHILRLTPSSPSTWFWASFEQVDNVSVPAGATFNPTLAAPGTTNGTCPADSNQPPPPVTGNIPWSGTNTPVNVCRVTSPFPSDIQAANATWQTALAGTVWANYEMIGVINPPVPGGPVVLPAAKNTPYTPGAASNTDRLANTTMETYVQVPGSKHGAPSCLDCHNFGFPQYAPTTNGDYQVFTFLLSNADSSDVTKAKPLGLPKMVRDLLRQPAKAKTKDEVKK